MVRQWIVTPSFAGSSPVVRPNVEVNRFLLSPDIVIINNVLPNCKKVRQEQTLKILFQTVFLRQGITKYNILCQF